MVEHIPQCLDLVSYERWHQCQEAIRRHHLRWLGNNVVMVGDLK